MTDFTKLERFKLSVDRPPSLDQLLWDFALCKAAGKRWACSLCLKELTPFDWSEHQKDHCMQIGGPQLKQLDFWFEPCHLSGGTNGSS